jgi:hypothetical protein
MDPATDAIVGYRAPITLNPTTTIQTTAPTQRMANGRSTRSAHRDRLPLASGRPRFKCIECRHLLDGTEPHWGRAPTKGELAQYARTSRSGPGGP